MASNRFGRIFTFSSFGESHGKAIGGVIDGCPAGLKISHEEIQKDLNLRKPGKKFTSPRNESDEIEILSGIFDGQTTGAPIGFILKNSDQKKESYGEIQHLFRPGHANYTYLNKYGIFDPFGEGRASARETATRVVAGSIAKQILKNYGIEVIAFVSRIGKIESIVPHLEDISELKILRNASSVYTLDPLAEKEMTSLMESLNQEGDSIGGVVQVMTTALPIGLGDPVYDKLEAWLAFAMLSIPGTKGFSIGKGFDGIETKGSSYHDQMEIKNLNIKFLSNKAGGTLGGISNGMPLCFQVAFKPTSSIKKPLATVTLKHENDTITHPATSRHDPCIAIRGTIVVEAMTHCVLLDALLANRLIKL